MAKLKNSPDEPLPTGDVPKEPKKGKVLDERWYVEEYFPPRLDPSTGIPLPEMWSRNYAEPFAKESEANSWIALHQPDFEGGKFRKAHEQLVEVVTTVWTAV